jgi:DNA-binding IclR family transcriptional regulator
VPPDLSPLARVVYRVLEVAEGTAEDLARETKLPVAVVDSALAELRGAGLAEELETRRWRIVNRRPERHEHSTT